MKIKLNLGSGIHVKRGFINVDLYEEHDLRNHTGVCKNSIWEKGAKYIKADIRKLPFKDNYADYIELFEVLEHLPFREVIPTLIEIRRVMKPKAKLLLHTPNFDGLMRDWIEMLLTPFDAQRYIDVTETVFGNQRAMGEFHQCPFNPAFMNYCLTQAGFKQGKQFNAPRGAPVPTFGSEKADKTKVMRNDVLFVEVIK